jgi:hypothetical protein
MKKIMTNIIIAIFFILINYSLSFCDFDTLSGDLPSIISSQKGPYLVISDIYVPAGKSVTIESGCVFLFKNFVGLHILGMLNAKGTKEKPIVFTSENDKRFNNKTTLVPNPYDWNGIFIHNDAIGTDLQNVEICYSVYGINSLTKYFKVTNGIFRDNGRANLTIEGKTCEITKMPFSYSVSVKDAKIDGVPIKILSDPQAQKRNTLRYCGLIAMSSGIITGAIFTSQWNVSKKQMSEISNDLFTYQSSDYISARNKRNINAIFMTTGYFLGFIGAFGFTYSFTF